jgi:hypothetical protein
MAHMPKRQRTEQSMDQVDALFDIDSQAFQKDISIAKDDALESLSKHISELQQSLEAERDSRKTEFADIPLNVIVSHVFPFFENRTDRNNFALVTKDIRNAVKNHKKLVLPWPDNCRLLHASFGDESKFMPTFHPTENLFRFVHHIAEFTFGVEEKVSLRAGQRIMLFASAQSPIHQTVISLFQVVTTERSTFGMQPMTILASKPCNWITKRCLQLPFHQTGKSLRLGVEASETQKCF